MIKYDKLRDIFLIIFVLLLVWQIFFSPTKEKIVTEPIKILLPEIKGNDTKTINTVIPIPAYINNNNIKEKIIVDSIAYNNYIKAKDSISKLNLYLSSIKINNYKDTLINNDTINIYGEINTQGKLLDYKIDYLIKKRQINTNIIPINKIYNPRLSIGLNIEGGVPTEFNSNFILKTGIILKNKNNNSINISYDTDKRIWIGIGKTFNLIK